MSREKAPLLGRGAWMWVLSAFGLALVGLVGFALLATDGPSSRTPSGSDLTTPPPSSIATTTGSPSPVPATSPTGSSSPSGSLSPSLSPPPTGPAVRPGPLPNGTWAGPGLTLVVDGSGATAEFDCASGAITHQLRVDSSGALRAEGTYAPEPGGPVGPSEPAPTTQRASWSGTWSGGPLRVSVQLSSGTSLGPFRLVLGADPQLEKCL